MDHVLEYMKKNDLPLTREKYLELAQLGDPPEELSAEQEAELPEHVQEHSDDRKIRATLAGSITDCR